VDTVRERSPEGAPDDTTTRCNDCGSDGLIEVRIQADFESLSYLTCLDCNVASWKVDGHRSSGDDVRGAIRRVSDATKRRGSGSVSVKPPDQYGSLSLIRPVLVRRAIIARYRN
jgi:hypothetical protein